MCSGTLDRYSWSVAASFSPAVVAAAIRIFQTLRRPCGQLLRQRQTGSSRRCGVRVASCCGSGKPDLPDVAASVWPAFAAAAIQLELDVAASLAPGVAAAAIWPSSASGRAPPGMRLRVQNRHAGGSSLIATCRRLACRGRTAGITFQLST